MGQYQYHRTDAPISIIWAMENCIFAQIRPISFLIGDKYNKILQFLFHFSSFLFSCFIGACDPPSSVQQSKKVQILYPKKNKENEVPTLGDLFLGPEISRNEALENSSLLFP
jgi:hypothetical protein